MDGASSGPPVRLVTRRGLLCAAWATALTALSFATGLVVQRGEPGLGGLFNDFADYWAAARILNAGGDPYDVQLVGRTLADAGMHTLVGTGYSYPLLLAEVLRPLAMLPPLVAGALFSVGGLACFALAVALLVSPLRSASWRELALVSTAAGTFAPVGGSLYMGQVNPWLLPLLALALLGIGRPAAIAASAAVKLYPVASVPAFMALGRRGLRPLLVTTGLALALAVGPNLVTGRWSYGSSLVQMLGPDPYWTNQSVNGWLSRLARGAAAPLPGLPVTPVMVLVCAALGALAMAVAARQRRSWAGAYAVLLCWAVLAAPKNSLWNQAPLLVVMAYAWPLARGRRTPALLLAASFLLIDGLAPAMAIGGAVLGSGAASAWLGSTPLLGALLLGGVLCEGLLRAPAAVDRHDDADGRAGPGRSGR